MVDVKQQGEVLRVKSARRNVFLDGSRNSLGNHQRFKRDAVKLCLCLIYVQAATQEDPYKTRATAVDRDVEVANSDAQIVKAIKELGELIVELARHRNGLGNVQALREELADAFVMLNQMELIFGDVTEIEIAKLERLEGMIENASV